MKRNYDFTPSRDGRSFILIGQFVTDEGTLVEKHILFETITIEVGGESFRATNLALIDVFEDGTSSDMSRTGNGNTEKIFITIAIIVAEFFLEANPRETIYFRGSDPAGVRTRLYGMQLSRQENYEIVTQYVGLYALSITGQISEYKQNDRCYAFLIKRKR